MFIFGFILPHSRAFYKENLDKTRLYAGLNVSGGKGYIFGIVMDKIDFL